MSLAAKTPGLGGEIAPSWWRLRANWRPEGVLGTASRAVKSWHGRAVLQWPAGSEITGAFYRGNLAPEHGETTMTNIWCMHVRVATPLHTFVLQAHIEKLAKLRQRSFFQPNPLLGPWYGMVW